MRTKSEHLSDETLDEVIGGRGRGHVGDWLAYGVNVGGDAGLWAKALAPFVVPWGAVGSAVSSVAKVFSFW